MYELDVPSRGGGSLWGIPGLVDTRAIAASLHKVVNPTSPRPFPGKRHVFNRLNPDIIRLPQLSRENRNIVATDEYADEKFPRVVDSPSLYEVWFEELDPLRLAQSYLFDQSRDVGCSRDLHDLDLTSCKIQRHKVRATPFLAIRTSNHELR